MPDYTLPLEELPDPLPIEPLTKPFDVTITPPGSKSITCRAYVLAALAEGESKIIRPLRADDTDKLLDALCTLGAEAKWDGEDVYIKGVAGRFPRGGHINLGDGGTPTRFMIACACLAAEPVVVDGSPRMRERPIAEGVDMLRELGAKIEYIEEEGRLPVRVSPSDSFKGGELTIGKTASSQFISAIILIASMLPNGASVRYAEPITSESYVDLTLTVIAEWGADYTVDHKFLQYSKVRGCQVKRRVIKALDYLISRDASSAAYWAVATALTPRAAIDLRIDTGDLEQPDMLCLGALADAGVEVSDCYAEYKLVGPQELRAFQFNASGSPDGALALATMAAECDGCTILTGLRTLRVKETDRIAALASELRKVGCVVETTEDSITITPMKLALQRAATVRERDRADNLKGEPLPHGRGSSEEIIIETYNDHRMAMAFAVLGLVRPGISIKNPACVAKSYPNFWRDFAKLYQ